MSDTMPGHDIIVIGASAGGVQAVIELARGLPAGLPAAVFVVIHTSRSSPGAPSGFADARGAAHGRICQGSRRVRRGHIYIASPDYHLVLEDGQVRVVHGPKENGFRPAVDPLFRTAAAIYGPRVAGVILSGSLDDGTAGLR